MAHLLFLPEGNGPGFFLWGAASPSSVPAHGLERALLAKGEAREAWVAGASGAIGRRKGVAIGLVEAVRVLAAVPMDEVGDLPGSFGAWSAASKLALELAFRGRFAPRVFPKGAAFEARWEVSLADRRDAERFEAIARAMPLAAHAVPLGAGGAGIELLEPAKPVRRRPSSTPKKPPLWPREALLYAFLSASVDALVRESVALHVRSSDAAGALAKRSRCSPERADVSIKWELRFIYALVSEDGSLALATPEERQLPDELGSWSMPAFAAGGGGVQPEPCVRVRMRIGGGPASGAGARRDRAGEADRIDLSGALRCRWEVTVDGASVRAEEARGLLQRGALPVSAQGPLTTAEEAMLAAALRLIAQGSGLVPARAALRALLVGSVAGIPGPVEVVTDRALSACLDGLAGRGEARPPELPASIREVCSPTMERGIAWLARRVSLGLGGWYVDEDGPSRRFAAIALLNHLAETRTSRSRKRGSPPPLVICADPAAWEAAIALVAPPLVPVLHCGPHRAESAAELKPRAAGRGLVLTTYEELSGNADLLEAVEWPLVLFDEADARAIALAAEAQRLRARCRIGLAGAAAAADRRMASFSFWASFSFSFWGALELVSPGLLGSAAMVRRAVELPIERFRDPKAEALLARVVRLFVFRAAEPAPGAAVDASPDEASEASARREEAGG